MRTLLLSILLTLMTTAGWSQVYLLSVTTRLRNTAVTTRISTL